VRKLGGTEQTYYRWRKEYGGLRMDQAKRLKEFERANSRLKKLLAEQALDNGPEFTAAAVRQWLGQVGVDTLFIEPGSPVRGLIPSFGRG
jgi:transposase InsO family protein